jgi:hypothetical protein
MTEAEWLACTDPGPMLDFLCASGRASDRKFRLFGCACCRRIWDAFPDPRNRDLVAVVENRPDGNFNDPVLDAAVIASYGREPEFRDEPAYWAAWCLGRGFYTMSAAQSAFVVAIKAVSTADGQQGREAEAKVQAALLRDIIGPLPFRPVAFDPAWRTRTAVAIAQVIYDERDFSLLPVLADALEEAGCENANVLAHCRQPGEHVRGCWVVDLVLGKP